MIGFRYAVPFAALFLGSACVVSTPQPVPIPQGVQVRVSYVVACPPDYWCVKTRPKLRAEGTLITLDADTLVLYVKRKGGEDAIPVSEIVKLEVYRGQKASVESAARGVVIGAAAGAALGATAGAVSEAMFGGMFGGEVDIGRAAAEGAAVGVVAGAVSGGAIGASVGSPVWDEVTVERLREELCHCRLSTGPSESAAIGAGEPGRSEAPGPNRRGA